MLKGYRQKTGEPAEFRFTGVKEPDCFIGAMIALVVVAGVMQYSAQRSAANRAEAEAKRNADMIAAENEETARKMELQNKQAMSESRARAGASGALLSSGSTQGYLNEMKSVFNAEIDWLKRSGTMQEYNEIMRGRGIASGYRAQANIGLVKTASSAFSAGGGGM